MLNLTQYIKPELLILIPVLYAVGIMLKKSKVSDYLIPFLLGGAGVFLSLIWTIATGRNDSWQTVLIEIFSGITQGILTAGASDYAYQLIKQGQEAQACRICSDVKRKKEQGGPDGKE